MNTQLFWIILLVGVYNVKSTRNKRVLPNRQMSRERARKECAKTGGGLVNYSSVKSHPTAAVYLSQLVEGKAAWIEGFAELSPFLSWYGCFNLSNNSIYTNATENISLYLCSQTCLRYKSWALYIGIKNRSCHCIDNKQIRLMNYAAVNDSLCSLPCENNIVDSCGGHSFVSVYSIIGTRRMHWAQNEPSKRQCVYAKKYQTRFELHTASCHTLPAVKTIGYICMNSVSSGSVLTSACPKEDTAGAFCIVDTPSSRPEAYASCSERRGKLADPSSESAVGPKMTTNSKYWISVYRTFGISGRYSENKSICVAAVRINDTLYLEPDDCSEEKHYLCEQSTITHSRHYPTISSNTSPITTGTKSNNNPTIILSTTTGSISITTKAPDIGYVSPFAYIIPCILVVLLLVITIVVFVLYRRRKKHIKQHNCISDDTYTAIYEIDNLENGQTGSVVSSIQGQNEDSKCLISKSKPIESFKQTQTNKTEELSDKKNKKNKEMQEEDYDKIDFKQPGNVRKDAYEETNVYNHVLDTTDNNYDTTKAIKSFQSVDPCERDDTYSHIKDGVIIDDYCGLLVPGKKPSGRGNDTGVNYCYSMDVGLKDSSLGTDKLAQSVIVDDDDQDDVKNVDIGDTANQDEPITYTGISKFGAKNETEYSEIQ